MIAVRWPDGRVDAAATAIDLLRLVAAAQWEQPCSVRTIKRRLAVRCEAWSGTLPNPNLPAQEFVEALAEFGMFDLVDKTTSE